MGRNFARRVLGRLRRLQRGPSPVILMYHRVAEESFDPWGLAVSPNRFGEQLRWLKKRRQVLGLEEFSSLQRQGKLPAKAAAITFDDGYACNAGPAAQLLDEHGVPATIFLATGAIRSGREFWWDELEHLILGFEQEQLSIELPAGPLRVALGSRQADDRDWPPSTPPRTPRQRAFHGVWAALRELEPGEQEAALDQIREKANAASSSRDSHRPMTVEEVRSVGRNGVSLGAHSLSHTSLPARTHDEKEREIFGSRDECAAISGSAPTSFAYPFGDFDDECARIVEAAGFSCACTTVETGVASADQAFALPRLQTLNWTPAQMARALARL
jgi:peptidoglycan/xylan/chitin deacetylase (PgdA/CDA1 family)